MAFENLFLRSKKSLGGIQLDAVISESHSNKVKVTKNPVELGAEITDHAIIEPKQLKIVADVSDTPMGLAALGQIVDLVTGLFGTSTDKNLTRSVAAYNAMVKLQERLEPITVQTKLVLYQNMVITGIETDQNVHTSRYVSMVITLDEVLITESEIVPLSEDILQDGRPTEQGASAAQRGRQETTTPDSTVETSVLKTVTDFLGGL